MGIRKGSQLGSFRHSIVFTGRCTNTRCAAKVSTRRHVDIAAGYIGWVEGDVTCPCGTVSRFRSYIR